jgi:hypothetical protein
MQSQSGVTISPGSALEFLGSSTCVYAKSGRYRPRPSIESCGLYFASASYRPRRTKVAYVDPSPSSSHAAQINHRSLR